MKLAEVVLTSDAGPAGGAPLVLVVVPPPFAPLGAWDLNESPDAGRESQRLSRGVRRRRRRVAEEDGIDDPAAGSAGPRHLEPARRHPLRGGRSPRDRRGGRGALARAARASDGVRPPDGPTGRRGAVCGFCVPQSTSFHTVIPRFSATPRDGDVGRKDQRDQVVDRQRRERPSRDTRAPPRSRSPAGRASGVIDHPSSTSSTSSTCCRIGPTLPRNSPVSRSSTASSANPSRSRALVHPLDPLARLLHAERVRVEPHVDADRTG